MKKSIFYLLCPLFFLQCTTLKHDTTNTSQLGFGAKMRVDFSGDKNSNYQISVTGGAAQSVLGNSFNFFYQPSLILYQGGLGNKSTFKDINKFRFELVNAFGVVLGFGELNTKNTEGVARYAPLTRPLISWSVSNAVALNNLYAYGLTLSSNFIWSNARNADSVRQVQRTGFIGVSLPYMSVGYSNDGPPFHLPWLPLGDAYDRYWTGRGFAQFDFDFRKTYSEKHHFSQWQFTIEYDRFTGFSRDNYEVANKLGLRFVPYGTESAWNKGRWSLNLLNKNYNLGISKGFYNENRADLQNLIHRENRYPFHGNTYNLKKSIGFFYEFQNKIN
jgi:hypothetical protein